MKMYVPLDEARVELKRRWEDVDLRKRIEAELGDKFMPAFAERPRAISFRQVCSPDNGFTFFYQCAKYIGAEPLILEYHGDIFVHFNAEKKGLGRLRVTQDDGTRSTVDIMNFHENEKKPLGDCLLKSDENLVNFHHKLFDVSGYRIEFLDNTEWFHSVGKAAEYYYPILLHCVAHGILFETFMGDEDIAEERFTSDIVVPTIQKIRDRFGLAPLVVNAYPENQNDIEDFYWWSYPPHVNQYLLAYSAEQKLPLKNVLV